MHSFVHMLVQLLNKRFWNVEAVKNLAFLMAHASSKNSEVCTPYFCPQPRHYTPNSGACNHFTRKFKYLGNFYLPKSFVHRYAQN